MRQVLTVMRQGESEHLKNIAGSLGKIHQKHTDEINFESLVKS